MCLPRTKNIIFKYNSVYTFHQCSFLLLIWMSLLPQGEMVETCQIWREESTYKFLCMSIKPCKFVRQLTGIKKGIKMEVFTAWQKTAPSFRQEGRHQDNHYSNYLSTEGTRTINTVTTFPQNYACLDTQRVSWHQDTITDSPLAVKWLGFGLVFKRSSRSLLHNTNNKEDKLIAVTRIFGNPLSNLVSSVVRHAQLFLLSYYIGDMFRPICRSSSGLLLQISPDVPLLYFVSTIYAQCDVFHQLVSSTVYPLGIFIRLLPTGDGILR